MREEVPYPAGESRAERESRAQREFRAVGLIDLKTKRAADLLVATGLLILLSPVILIIALAIKLDSEGPVFYRARRVGQHGREFGMLKFRKMHRDASGPPLTAANDSRLTRLGVFLARSKLDELPQLVNVIRGEMSLVGPRPEDPSFVRLHPGKYGEVLQAKPGITGLSQLAFARESRILQRPEYHGSYADRILPAKLQTDGLYINRRSILLDARILAWTAAAVVLGIDVAVDRATGRLSTRRRPPCTQVPRGREVA